MRVSVVQIRSLGLDWPTDRIGPDGIVDLAAIANLVDSEFATAERVYFGTLGAAGSDAARERYFELRELGDHTAVVRALLTAIGGRSLGTGPIPRSTIDTLQLPCSRLLDKKLVAVGDEVDLVKTMELLVRNYRYYQREYNGLDEQRRRYNASRDDISDRWDELSSGMADNETAIRELSAILAAVCR